MNNIFNLIHDNVAYSMNLSIKLLVILHGGKEDVVLFHICLEQKL